MTKYYREVLVEKDCEVCKGTGVVWSDDKLRGGGYVGCPLESCKHGRRIHRVLIEIDRPKELEEE